MRKLKQIAHRASVARTPLPARGEGLGEGFSEMRRWEAPPCYAVTTAQRLLP